MDVLNSLSGTSSNKDFDSAKTNNNSNKNGNGNSGYKTISLNLSEDLRKENVLSEIKYMPSAKTLKVTFSKQYNDKVVFAPLEVKKWQNSAEKDRAKDLQHC